MFILQFPYMKKGLSYIFNIGKNACSRVFVQFSESMKL